ncbi:alpha/beta hydrolase [Mycobacterium sp. OTB74]|jgi:triacylglycerol lipase|uniref:alpha/beta hydrolase n=1 Tax=Mycobacterium sp. OTB74 TaxID=1853452 RepID=UPI0024765659|nr:alpha/beta hydrolase [Mycobacterium sp. OTB74]MDH6245547.1 acetyl esterase/lipase [Mycobacterium sp. OTB74]
MLSLLALARRELGGALLTSTGRKTLVPNAVTTSMAADAADVPSVISETLDTITTTVSSGVTSVVNFVVGVSPSPSSPGTALGFGGQPSLVMALGVLALGQLTGIDVTNAIAPAATSTSPPAALTLGLNVTKTEYDGMAVYEIASSDPSGEYVVAIHGGAYVGEPSIVHWLSYTSMVRATNATVVVPIYPQIGDGGNAATVVPEMADLISQEISQYGARNVSVIGDSAGGGLALAAVELMVSQNMQVPKSLVLVSPWLDVTMSNPAIAAVDDPVLKQAGLVQNGLSWAGDLSATDPLVSPLYGSLAGLPPTYVYAGSEDLLSPDVLVLQKKAIAQGAPISFILRSGEIHDWALLPILDGGQVQDQIYQELGLMAGVTTLP